MLLVLLPLVASGGPVSPFSCETAPAHLGFPAGRAVRCAPFQNLPSLYAVRIEDASLEHPKAFVVAVADGQPVRERGAAAAVRFLEAAAPQAITLGEAKALFGAFEAWPPGFGPDEQAPADARYAPSVTLAPLSLVVYARPPVGAGPGPAPQAEMRRATLRADAHGRYAWTIAVDRGAGWETIGTIAVEP